MVVPCIAFIGGSFTSLVLAYYIKTQNPETRVVIIEKEAQAGGLKRSIHYEDGIKFDNGAHMLISTGIAELDKFLLDLLPEGEWEILSGYKRDVSGIYFNNKIQAATHSPDLRTFSDEAKRKFFADILECIDKFKDMPANTSLYEMFKTYLGDSITNEILRPIYESKFSAKLEDLGHVALSILQVFKVILFNSTYTTDLRASHLMSMSLDFPSVYDTPEHMLGNRYYSYPKKHGMGTVTESLIEKAEAAGVEIKTNTTLTALNQGSGKINSISIDEDGSSSDLDLDQIFWAVGLPHLAKYLNIDIGDTKIEKLESVFVHMLLDKKPNAEDLYYISCLDPEMHTFRVTNYSAFCSGAKYEQGYPLTVNMMAARLDPSDDPKQMAVEELKTMGIIADHKVNFIAADRKAGLPVPTIQYENKMAEIRKKITDQGLSNLVVTGILSEPKVFYMYQDLTLAFGKQRSLV